MKRIDLLVKNALLKGRNVDVAIDKGVFLEISPTGQETYQAKKTLDATGMLMRAPFYNTHTHHAMVLFRGVDDQCSLMDWLKNVIWPREANLSPEAVYAGTRLAILESIKCGCVGFNDMYFHQPQILRAAQTMGVRAQVGLMYMDQVSQHIENEATLALRDTLPPTLHLAVAPHALYTTTREQLESLGMFAHQNQLPIHIHAAETLTECAIARNQFHAKSPIQYLDTCGLLNETTILAHCCHLTDEDREIIAQRKSFIAHCPHSNLKLASGTFDFVKAHTAGIKVTVGTDGAASNNALSMIAEAKTAALLAKATAGSPDALPIDILDRSVTSTAAAALGFPNAGKIEAGAEADFILVTLNAPAFIGMGNPDANFLYAGDPSMVDTVVCAGNVLMQQHVVPEEDEILAAAQVVASQL